MNVRVARPPATYNSAFSGTSASCPHVAGAVALLWSAAPQLIGNVAATIDLLKHTALPLTSTQDCGGFSGAIVSQSRFSGFGRLDVNLAVDAAAPPTRPDAVLSPRHGDTRTLPPRN